MGDQIIQAPRSAGVGYPIPERTSDVTGVRPGWFPFQIEVGAEELDDADPVPLSDRHLSIGDPVEIDWWPFP